MSHLPSPPRSGRLALLLAGSLAAGLHAQDISGVVYNDLSANAQRDGDDHGLAFWAVYDDADRNGVYNAGEISTVTDLDGVYRLTGLPEGDRVIRLEVQYGWRQSVPGWYLHQINAPGTYTYTTDFGAFRPNQVSGTVFNDLNRNASKEGTEARLPGWDVYVDTDNDGTRDAGTLYSDLWPGNMPAPIEDDYAATAVAFVYEAPGPITDVNVTVRIAHTYDSDLDLYLGGSGDHFTNTTFDDQAGSGIASGSAPFSGSYRPTSPLSVLNGGDAVGTWYLEAVDRAGGDVGRIDDFKVRVSYGERKVVSNQDGNYTLGNLGDGTYRIREIVKSGWIQSSPVTLAHTVTLFDAASAGSYHFGNHRLASASGLVFRDFNANGIKDGADTPLPNWQMFVDTNQNKNRDSGTLTKYPSDLPKPIPDPGRVTSTINVSGIPGVVTDLNLRLTVGYLGGIRVTLIDPVGRRMPVYSDLYGEHGASFNNVTFDDQAGTPIEGRDGPFSGSYRPMSPLKLANGFSANGTWRLEVEDVRAHETSSLTAWSLVFGFAEIMASSNSAGVYTLNNIPAGSYRIDQRVGSGWYTTFPTAGYHPITVGSGSVLTGLNFGDTMYPAAAN
jgi:subtilisin-like proprotein convertase family protein